MFMPPFTIPGYSPGNLSVANFMVDVFTFKTVAGLVYCHPIDDFSTLEMFL